MPKRDAAGGKVSQEKQLEIRDTMEDVVDAMKEYDDKSPVTETVLAEDASDEAMIDKSARLLPTVVKENLSPSWQVAYPVLCIASRSALDQAAAVMLAQILDKHGDTLAFTSVDHLMAR